MRVRLSVNLSARVSIVVKCIIEVILNAHLLVFTARRCAESGIATPPVTFGAGTTGSASDS